jgi:ABC-type transport system involved in Fe-S cluster assembly fused permease/ATPase subunit
VAEGGGDAHLTLTHGQLQVICDEATSALDSTTEKGIQAVRELSRIVTLGIGTRRLYVVGHGRAIL